ncbi:multidrug ABC transporter ATP-binding protein [Moorella thermoacetica]|uniref:ABC transporter related protein n=1 Tax=Moorella thermoacetica (strain ATCC 39073 / JCM 9320) TaxID=264732 RepID=Q2RJW4_MOOTA|nr:ABC transporter ATP-binding protein [Moorella thermoacetica]AKX93719.1 putative ABC transporter ATP-binding protein YxlF [Moorella thermoacetica]AKX96361.1 putative ABC transporter ATP-binding protein YxlF [Moorella thermoacetica]OIQ10865.1 putative ABC transporter ATP-binding protein YxlF [Moorella thermoacetica]OIQ54922.1 putative ABC transporter ATP-binding protein YxlF [Moorella thermoacetica]QDA00175.1 putative ABC transporter ATP-binding protein YxlF [Moorella thermoacetica]
MAVIEARNLTKIYGRQVACREICLSVEEGQIFGLLGPNGAGKSTLVKMLVGLVYPTAGEALVAGYSPQDIRGRRQVGFLPENFRLHGWLKGQELLTFHAQLAGLDGRAASRRAHEVLGLVGLSGEGQKLVANYSKGMQQRLALAAALVGDPRVVFLDEPTSALDPLGRRQVREILLALKEAGKTVFLNSHLLSEVEQVCDQVAIINRGTVVASGRLAELQSGPATVAIRLAGLTGELEAELRRRYPSLRLEGDRLTLDLGGREEVADLVARLVAGGCRIYEVTPGHSSLEDVFVYLVREGEQACG